MKFSVFKTCKTRLPFKDFFFVVYLRSEKYCDHKKFQKNFYGEFNEFNFFLNILKVNCPLDSHLFFFYLLNIAEQ